MDWHLLPEPLRALDQWVCADDEKQPRNAKNGGFAAVDNPLTWTSFSQACKVAIANGWDIGFVLATTDPFTIVDLDNKPHNPAPPSMRKVHQDIINGSETYIERSVSGTGYHVIVEGMTIKPIKTDWIEMYSSHRFMICTGYAIKDLPVADGAPLIDLIEQHFRKASDEFIDLDADLLDFIEGVEELPDDEIIRRGMEAENSDKFASLWEGNLDYYNGDHSRADNALLNLLCFLTPHNEQVRRIFRQSKLYRPTQRNRSGDGYLNRSIITWRAENPPLDMSKFDLMAPEQHGSAQAVAIDDEPEPIKAPSIPKVPAQLSVPSAIPKAPAQAAAKPSIFPPGILGELAQHIFENAYIPMAESALVATLGYAAGLIGRGFHINGLGLNQYMCLLAESGEGKEGGKKGIRRFHKLVYANVPSAVHAIGSADFSAGVSLAKSLAEHPCFLGIAGELGVTLRGLLDPRANQNTRDLKRAFTDGWSESGPDGVMNGRKYSDRTKDAGDVQRPCLSIIGESVASHFYGALSADVINDGFIPRWNVLEHDGTFGEVNRNDPAPFADSLVERFQDLFVASKTTQDSNMMTKVTLAHDAKVAFHQFEDGIRAKARSMPSEHPLKAILNRTNEKALKFAALLAACENPHIPMVTLEMATWSMQFVSKCDGFMTSRFEDGSVGEGEDNFDGLIRKFIRHYQGLDAKGKMILKCPKPLVETAAISHSSFASYLKQRAAFKNHRNGAIKAVEMAIGEALQSGLLVKMPASEKVKVGLRGGEAYLLGSGW